MKLIFIPFMNGIFTETGGDGKPLNARKWREQQEETFLAQERALALTRQINALRAQKPNDGAAFCKPCYLQRLHDLKCERQRLWVRYLEGTLCVALDKLLAERIRLDPDLARATLVAALPEFFWCDINDNDKTRKNGRFISGYKKPLYESVLMRFLTETPPENEGASLRSLTQRYPNLIVFAGTAWWKFVNTVVPNAACAAHMDAGATGAACRLEADCLRSLQESEKIHNTMPVFCGGMLCFTWNKQFVSDNDGLGDTDAPHNMLFLTKGDVLSDFKRLDGNPSALPLVKFNGVTFGVDICLDFVQNEQRERGESLSKSLLKGLPVPEVQLLIAANMPLRDDNEVKNRYFSAKTCLLRCDACADRNGSFADIWQPNARREPLLAPEDGSVFAFRRCPDVLNVQKEEEE